MKKEEYLGYEVVRIDLPSMGKVYPVDSPLAKGYVEMRYMTAKHEDILTNPNKINRGVYYLINEFAKSLIVDDIDYNDLIEGDSFQILIASRILSYGKMYEFMYKGNPEVIDLSQIPNKEIDYSLFNNSNEVKFELPVSGNVITLKLLTIGDLIKIDNESFELEKNEPDGNFKRELKLKHMILSVNGDYDKKIIHNFIENRLISWDIREIFDFVKEISPDVDFKFKPNSTEGIVDDIPFLPIKMFFPDKRV